MTTTMISRDPINAAIDHLLDAATATRHDRRLVVHHVALATVALAAPLPIMPESRAGWRPIDCRDACVEATHILATAKLYTHEPRAFARTPERAMERMAEADRLARAYEGGA